MYTFNVYEVQDNLIVLIQKGIVGYPNGNKAFYNDGKAVNFSVTLAGSGSKKVFEFVSGNVHDLILCHTHKTNCF